MTLVKADGQLLRSAPPAGYRAGGGPTSGGSALFPSTFHPLWTSGEQVDAFGYHDTTDKLVPFDVIYRTQPVVAAVVNKISRIISTFPLKPYRKEDNGSRKRVRRGAGDPAGERLLNLIERPAPRCGPIHLKQWIVMPPLVFGNGVLAKWYGDGKDMPPTEFIPLDYRYLQAYAQPGGYVELWQTTQLGSPRWIDAEQTVHFAWGNPCGPLGISPLEQLAVSLRLEDAAQRWQTASFRNSARPASVIIPPEGARFTEEDKAEMRNSLQAMHQGPDNAFKVGLLAPGSQWKEMGFNMQEAELMNTRKFSRDEVCMVYDVKPSHIGDLSTPGAGYGSVVEVNRDLARTTLRSWCSMIEETLQAQLIDPEPLWDGLFLEFDMKEMLRGEPEAEANTIATQIKTGQITPAEAREINNRAPVDQPGMDKLYIETNNLSPIGEAPAEPAQMTLPGTDQAPPEQKPARINVVRDEAGKVTGYERA